MPRNIDPLFHYYFIISLYISCASFASTKVMSLCIIMMAMAKHDTILKVLVDPQCCLWCMGILAGLPKWTAVEYMEFTVEAEVETILNLEAQQEGRETLIESRVVPLRSQGWGSKGGLQKCKNLLKLDLAFNHIGARTNTLEKYGKQCSSSQC